MFLLFLIAYKAIPLLTMIKKTYRKPAGVYDRTFQGDIFYYNFFRPLANKMNGLIQIISHHE